MKTQGLYLSVLSVALLAACAPQSTPSMMNTNKVQLQHQVAVQQVPLADINDVTLTLIADDYRRYGHGPLDLTMVFDPKSSGFTAMQARNRVREIETNLKERGIRTINVRTAAVDQGKPSLMVSYESYQAQAPENCHTMPGVDGYQTTRHIGDYRFGCTTESLLARQIARPADLMGRGADGMPSDGRRAANIVEEWRNYGSSNANAPLERIGRDDIAP